jgi:drug/metabolite transporter (DMT)-like permease
MAKKTIACTGDSAQSAGVMNRSPDGTTYAAFAGAVLIGGANFIAVSMSNMELPPLFGAMLRFGLASVLFLLIAAAGRVPLATGRSVVGPVLYGLLGFGAAYALLYYALVGLTAGTAAVIVAAAPLFTLVLAVLLGQERLSVRGVVGGVLAIAGIGVLSLGAIEGHMGASYLIAAILATLAIALSSVVAKRYSGVPPVQMNAIGMIAGTALLTVSSLVLGEQWTLPRESRTWMAVGWLVVLGSVGLFQLFLFVIRRWTASATVYAVAAMPVVAAGLGVVMLDQPLTGEVVAGGVMVIAAVYVGAISPKVQQRAAVSRS